MYSLKEKEGIKYQYKKASKKCKGVIFFVHGYAVNSSYHNLFSDKVNDYDYYAIEHAGHGITPLINKKELKPIEYAKGVVKLIEALDLKDIYLIGHSMGGGICMMVAKMIPERIKKMVIVTPMNSKGTTKVFNFLFRFQPKDLKQADRLYDILMYDYKNNKHKIPPNEINEVIKLHNDYRKNFNKLKYNMASLANMNELKKAEKNIPVKTLLIVGKYDDCINQKSTIKNIIEKKNKDNKLVSHYLFEDAGHIPFLEQTEKYYKVIMDFINE